MTKRMGATIKYKIRNNPVRDVPKDSSVEKACDRALSWIEIKTLWNTSSDIIPTHIHLALKLMLATGGQRPSEVIEASMTEFDLDNRIWCIPSKRTKNKQPHIVPLTDLAIRLIGKIRALTGDKGPWLFPSCLDPDRKIPMRRNAISNTVKGFCNEANFEKFVPKDIRRTVKTRMGELKVPKFDRDLLQNHARKEDVSSKHYDRYDYLAEKQEAIKIWCDYLEHLVEGNNVIPIKMAMS